LANGDRTESVGSIGNAFMPPAALAPIATEKAAAVPAMNRFIYASRTMVDDKLGMFPSSIRL